MRLGPSPELQTKSRNLLVQRIADFHANWIVGAHDQICAFMLPKINNGDVIITYGHSYAVNLVLRTAWTDRDIRFSVIALDSGPRHEGRKTAEALGALGIPVVFAGLHAAATLVPRASRVLLGAAAMQSNGSMLARVGTACVAAVAVQAGVPVVVCCASYKFQDRAQLDSICSNELGDPDDVARDQPEGRPAGRGGGVWVWA